MFFYKEKTFRKAVAVLMLLVLIFSSAYIIRADSSVETLSKLGSRGEEVRRIQTKLKELGYYSGSIDGIYGSQTLRAVKAFQKNCGISVDGIAGPVTLKYLGLGTSQGSGGYTSSDINLLAKLIAAEARGEPYIGQVAVGAVVLNRVEHASFPDSISGVIYQRGAFSCVNDSNWYVSPDSNSIKAARDCINGWDPSYGAIYYFNPAKTSNSFMHSRPVITTIGSHVFCS